MKMKNNKLKYIFILIGIILIIFLMVIGILVFNKSKQEDILRQEIIDLSNKDLLESDYDITVKTDGDYAYIEKAIKKYYKELSINMQKIDNYLSDENLVNILSIDNIKINGPKFEKSHKILNETREISNEAMKKIIDLCSEENIKNLIDKDKVSSYSYNLYLELMYTDDDLAELSKTKDEMQIINNNLNTFLDKVEAIVNLLADNSDYWFIDGGQLYFKKSNLVNEYNNLYNDLNDFVTKNFSNTTKVKTTQTKV